MTHLLRILGLSMALFLVAPHTPPARAQDEATQLSGVEAPTEEGSPLVGYLAAGALVCASIFALCKTARRS